MAFVKRVTLIGDSPENEIEENNWLVFERDASHLVDDSQQISKDDGLAVQIAFQVSEYEQDGRPSIIKLNQSNLSVFFPTEKETNLGFLVQGPYRTTPARDNISQGDPFNIALAEETGELVVEALRWLRERGWLTVGVLETMPLEFGKFYDSLLKPVYDRVRTAITDEALIPAYKTGYISGRDAVIAGSRALRDLLNGVQLQQLFETDRQIAWVSDVITDDLTPALYKYLTQSYQIDIDEIGAEQFAGRIEEEFLMNQSDDWIREFYEYASAFDSRSYPHSSPFNTLKRKPIIRLENGSHIAPYRNSWDDEPNVYLPTEHDSRFPTVRREVCNSEK